MCFINKWDFDNIFSVCDQTSGVVLRGSQVVFHVVMSGCAFFFSQYSLSAKRSLPDDGNSVSPYSLSPVSSNRSVVHSNILCVRFSYLSSLSHTYQTRPRKWVAEFRILCWYATWLFKEIPQVLQYEVSSPFQGYTALDLGGFSVYAFVTPSKLTLACCLS